LLDGRVDVLAAASAESAERFPTDGVMRWKAARAWRSLGEPKPTVLPREGCPMADKSPKKSSTKTAAAKSLKEKRADKKAKSSSKSTSA
jgi:hypothetical protein